MLRADPETLTRSLPARLHDSAFVAERTSAYLRERSTNGQPFFLCASFPDPHHPFDPPEEIAATYNPADAPEPIGSAADLATRPEHYGQMYQGRWHRGGVSERTSRPEGLDAATTRKRIANTAAMVELIDQNVGRILKTLSETGLEEDTLVLFTSDHGELLGDHGLWLKGPFFYEGLVNTPLLIAGPGVEAGSHLAGLSSAIDLAPTVCDALGVEAPHWNEGVSLAPMLRGEAERVRDHCCIEYRNGYGDVDIASRTLITQEAKYTRYETGVEELTDLATDPAETTNCCEAPEYAAALNAMREALLGACLATKSRHPEQITHA